MLTDIGKDLPTKPETIVSRLKRLEARSALLIPLFLTGFVAAIWPTARKPLWYDELFTYYIAKSANAHQFLQRIHFDLNPPLNYLLVAASLKVFGDNPLAARLPSILAYTVASLAIFALVRNRLGGFLGLTAMILTWSCGGFLAYATQARPYALVLAFLSLALLCWLRIQPGKGFSSFHWGLSGALAGMFLSHALAPLFAAPFFFGEFARALRRRTIDWWTWIALSLPIPLVLTYLRMAQRAEITLYPAAFMPSWAFAAAFYLFLLLSLGEVTWVLLIALVFTRLPGRSHSELEVHERVFLLATLLMPGVIMLYFAHAKVPFFQRYGIDAVVAVSVGLTFFVARKTKRHIGASAAAMLIAFVGFCVQSYLTLAPDLRQPPPSTAYRTIQADLPFVTASGLAFVEMDHREPADFVKRLYYLTDRDAAIRYAHATMFEGLPALSRAFPIRGKVAPYHDFIAAHPRFLVFGTPDYPEDWLLRKLKADGAEIRLVAELNTSYRDKMLFEVTVPRSQ